MLQTYEFVPADRSLLVMPLFHVHGLMAGLLAPLAAGAGVILPSAGRFAASTFWADAVQYGMTFYTAVPTMHQILLSRAEQDYPAAAPPPLRAIRSCSSSLAPATLHKVEAAFKAPVLEVGAVRAVLRVLCMLCVLWVGGQVGGWVGGWVAARGGLPPITSPPACCTAVLMHCPCIALVLPVYCRPMP